ncbi:MAG TPA: hypothetical protein PLP19_09510 [bacterium]|nr:hypothetical protein [bacterium]HPN43714.1 hypothetical protein [bacterium]
MNRRYYAMAFMLVTVLLFSIPAFAKVSSMQLFFLVKQAFPEASEVNIFISKANLAEEKDKIARATVQFQLKALIYDVDNAADIGNGTKKISDNSILIVYDDEVFANKTNKLYILSKCKEKKISLITSSMDYIQSGALLGYIEENSAKKIILNITHYDYLKEKFTNDVVQKIGVAEVIPPDFLTSAQ